MFKALLIKIIPFSALKILFLKLFGAKIGRNVSLGLLSTIYTKNYSKIVIGDYVEIGYNVNIRVSSIDIGNFTIIGNYVEISGNGNFAVGKSSFISHMNIDTSGGSIRIGDAFACSHGNISSHDYSETWFNPGKKYTKFNIEIGNRVWMGAGASALNVNIGNESLIAGGSIVLSDIPNNSFAIGNPARVIKKNEFKKINNEFINDINFQNATINIFKNKKIGFFEEFAIKNDNELKAYDIIICNKLNSKDIPLTNTPIISLSSEKVYNMRTFILPLFRLLRSYGIFIKN
tara:strand:+ start:248 stop:1114 length:867 start_codon:yes stop_codon:yes gene_type:complete